MLDFLDKYGIEIEGIFRISANAKDVHEAQVLLDIGRHSYHAGEEHTCAALLKSVLRKLPEALLVDSLSAKWLAATSPADFKELLVQLPPAHRAVLSRLISLMKKVRWIDVFLQMDQFHLQTFASLRRLSQTRRRRK
jgi:hypothetical protein